MKKLMMLVLVASLATTAQATYDLIGGPIATGNVSWSVVGSQLVGTNSSGVADSGGYGIGSGGGMISAIGPLDATNDFTGSHLPAAGNLGKVRYVPSVDAFQISAGSVGDDPGFGAGQWFVFDILGPATIPFYDFGQGLDPVGEGEIVPEPATIALLGIGGLLLRRRK
jgi:hypothetical protein